MRFGLLLVSLSVLAAGELDTAKKLIAAGSLNEAVVLLRSLVAADPQDPDACLLLGTALALVPRRSEAIEVLRRAVELRPDSAQAHLSMGMALARFGERDGARQAYEKAVALDPRLVMAHVNLGVILAAEDKLAEASGHFSEAIREEGDTPGAGRYYYLRGRVYRQ
jgi:Flp pilus assembly protein TadD